MALAFSVHSAPHSWPNKIEAFRERYNEVLENYGNTSGSPLDTYTGDRAVTRGLHGIVVDHLEPIGREFCEALTAQGLQVDPLGNMAVAKILHGEPVRIIDSDLDDKVHLLLRDLHEAKPLEPLLIKGLERYMSTLAKQPRDHEISSLTGLCNQYLQGREAGVFRAVRDVMSGLRDQEYSNLDEAACGSCYYVRQEGGQGTAWFQFALLLPPFMYVLPRIESAFIGEKGWGLLRQIMLQYKQPPLITPEFLERLKSVDPMHLAPIVGSLPSEAEFQGFKRYLPSAYTTHVSLVNLNGIQTTLPGNIFTPIGTFGSPKAAKPKGRGKKARAPQLQTLENFIR